MVSKRRAKVHADNAYTQGRTACGLAVVEEQAVGWTTRETTRDAQLVTCDNCLRANNWDRPGVDNPTPDPRPS